MSKYIVTSDGGKELKNASGNVIGVQEKRGLFYSKAVGRHRIYRSSFPNPANGLSLLVYKTKEKAQRICDRINFFHQDDFKVELYIEQYKTKY